MKATDVRFEYRLEGNYNFNPWKERIVLVYMENNLLEFLKTQVTPPLFAIALVTHNLKDVKARCIIIVVVNDHVIPNISIKYRFHVI